VAAAPGLIWYFSDYQFRRPNPQIRIVSKLFWTDQGTAEAMIPVKIRGRPHIISTNEAGGASGAGGWAAACARGASPFGYPNIIDVTDETNPKIIAKPRPLSDRASRFYPALEATRFWPFSSHSAR